MQQNRNNFCRYPKVRLRIKMIDGNLFHKVYEYASSKVCLKFKSQGLQFTALITHSKAKD